MTGFCTLHVRPENSCRHTHMKLLPVAKHDPPFKHGFGEQPPDAMKIFILFLKISIRKNILLGVSVEVPVVIDVPVVAVVVSVVVMSVVVVDNGVSHRTPVH